MTSAIIIFLTIFSVFCLAIHLLYRHQIFLFKYNIQKSILMSENVAVPKLIVEYPFKDLMELSCVINQLQEYKDLEINHTNLQNQILREQITAICHDLRTPLAAIKGYWELLEATDDAGEQEYYFEIIQQRLDLLSNLITDFYALTQITSNQSKLADLELLSPGEILEATLLLFFNDFNNRQLNVVPYISSTCRIIAEKAGLQRVYANILQNILRYGTREVEVHHHQDLPQKVKAWLSNAGISVPSAACYSVFINCVEDDSDLPLNCDILFQRFYRVDKSRTQQDKQVISTGLGLYICRMLLEKHGYKIFAVTNGQETDKQLAIIIAYPTTSLS